MTNREGAKFGPYTVEFVTTSRLIRYAVYTATSFRVDHDTYHIKVNSCIVADRYGNPQVVSKEDMDLGWKAAEEDLLMQDELND